MRPKADAELLPIGVYLAIWSEQNQRHIFPTEINMNTQPEQATPTQPAEQAAYATPELVDYGPIEVLTQSPGVGVADGITGSLVN